MIRAAGIIGAIMLATAPVFAQVSGAPPGRFSAAIRRARTDRHDVRRQQRQPAITTGTERVLGAALGRTRRNREFRPRLGGRRRGCRELARRHPGRRRTLIADGARLSM